MSLRIKLLAAAVAMAVSAGASAAIQGTDTMITSTGTTTGTNGSSEGLFTAYGNGVAYSFDLAQAGFNSLFATGYAGNTFLNDLITNTTTSLTGPATIEALKQTANGVIYDYALPNFDSFLSQAGIAASSVQFNLTFGDSIGTQRWLTSLDSLGSMSFAEFDNIKAAFGTYAGALNNKMTANGSATSSVLTDGWAITTIADGSAYGGLYGNNFGGKVASMDNTGFLGGAVDMAVMYGSATVAVGVKDYTMGGLQVQARTYIGSDDKWHLQLAAVPAVPEPETYAMMLAGLGMVGAMVRRRSR